MPFKHSVLTSFLCLCFSAPASSKFNPKWQKYSPNLCIQGHFDLWRCSSNWLRQPIVSRFACCFVLFFVCLFVSTWRRIVNCSLIGSLIYRIFNLFLDRGNCLRIDGSERWAEFDWRQSSQFAVNIHLFVLRHLCARVVYEWVFMSNPGNLLQLSGDTRLNCAQTTL